MLDINSLKLPPTKKNAIYANYSWYFMTELQSFSDLDVVDYLEIFNSTVQASSLLGISQSSCSRRYRALSESLEICFERCDNGYSATSNLDVLFLLRQASQKLRIRRNQFRYSQSWHSQSHAIPKQWQNFSILSMDQSSYMNLLSNRLLDICCMGLMEYEHILDINASDLNSKPVVIGESFLAYPLMEWNYILIAHKNHPLANKSDIEIDDLKKYPSPGLQFGVAPAFMTQIKKNGLGSSPYGISKYEILRWEAVSKDGYSLSYAPSHLLTFLKNKYNLAPLNYDLKLKESVAIIGCLDVMRSPSFLNTYAEFVGNLKNSDLYMKSSVRWYI